MLHMQAFLNLGWGLGNILGECQLPSFLKLPKNLRPHNLLLCYLHAFSGACAALQACNAGKSDRSCGALESVLISSNVSACRTHDWRLSVRAM